MKDIFFLFLIVTSISSCRVLNNNPKTSLKDGIYTSQNKKAVFVELQNEDVLIYETSKSHPDSFEIVPVKYESSLLSDNSIIQEIKLSKNSLDLDLITVPIKFRPSRKNVPAQLNYNINAQCFLGLRSDVYKINYHRYPNGHQKRQINHFGISFGVISGFGNAFMSPTNTNNLFNGEYDAVVFTKGLAAIIAINNFNIGLALGADRVLDSNNKIWIYQDKAWLGFTLGLNLN
jgi:hypothetical protein